MMELEAIRQSIDDIDGQLVKLLEARLALVSQVLAYKQAHQLPVLDENREQALLELVSQRTKNPAYQAPIRATFEDILKHSRAYQAQHFNDN